MDRSSLAIMVFISALNAQLFLVTLALLSQENYNTEQGSISKYISRPGGIRTPSAAFGEQWFTINRRALIF